MPLDLVFYLHYPYICIAIENNGSQANNKNWFCSLIG